MKVTLETSESLIGSLCREMEYIRNRYLIIKAVLKTAKDTYLKERLNLELDNLLSRKDELISVTKGLQSTSEEGNLSILFLMEICQRPITC